MRTVASVMTRKVITVTPETNFKEAVRLLGRNHVSGLPVVDAAGRLVGVVSEADLLNKAEKREPDAYVLDSRKHRLDRSRAAALDVASAMSRDVTTVRPDFSVARAAREMHARGFKRLPVVDHSGRLIGIVSRGDLLKVFMRSDEELQTEVGDILAHAAAAFRADGLTAVVSDGVVDLAGSFDSKSRLEATVRAIAAVDGIIGIRNRFVFAVDDGEFITLPSRSVPEVGHE